MNLLKDVDSRLENANKTLPTFKIADIRRHLINVHVLDVGGTDGTATWPYHFFGR